MAMLSRRDLAVGLASVAACGRIEASSSGDGGALDAAFEDAGVIPQSTKRCFPSFSIEGIVDLTPARRTLYTWTTKAQADELVATRQLYTNITDGQGRKGFLFDYLERVASRDRAAAALTQPDFERGRYAWAFPWATLMADEDYGRELVRIDLRPDSLFIAVEAGSDRYRCLDLDNVERLPLPALELPDQIAGIYFVNALEAGCGSWGGASGYREFHLCHETTVDEWSYRTADNLALLDDARAMLLAFERELRVCETKLPGCGEFLRGWRTAPTTDLERFMSCLAFSWSVSKTQSIRALVERGLERLAQARFTPSPVRHRPNG